MKNDWFKASVYESMTLGNRQFPGGMAAWGPTLVLLMGECQLGTRRAVEEGSDTNLLSTTLGTLLLLLYILTTTRRDVGLHTEWWHHGLWQGTRRRDVGAGHASAVRQVDRLDAFSRTAAAGRLPRVAHDAESPHAVWGLRARGAQDGG